MYVYYIDSPKSCKFCLKGSLLYTHTLSFYRYRPYQPLSTGSGSILGAGGSRASPGISIVSRGSHALYLELRQCPALPVRLRCRESNPRHAPSLLVTTPRRWPFLFRPTVLDGVPNHQKLEKLRRNSLVLTEIRTRAA